MPKNPHADFTPTLAGYSGITPFRFWCQTALPLTYDDSLSYYELLNKVVNYLNHTIEDLTNVENNTSELAEAYEKLQKYVNDYFDDIDIEAELRNVLDGMAEDGTLDALLDPLVANRLPGVVEQQIGGTVAEQIGGVVAEQIDDTVAEQLPGTVGEQIPEQVTEWLDNNVTPVGSAVVVDNTLTITGAAADAKVTGDKIRAAENGIEINSENLDYILGMGAVNVTSLNGLTLKNGNMNANGQLNNINTGKYKYVLFKIDNTGGQISLTASANGYTYIAALKSFEEPAAGVTSITLDYSENGPWVNRRSCAANGTFTGNLPDDCEYLLVSVILNEVDCTPTQFSLTVPGVEGKLNEIETRVENCEDAIDELNDDVDENKEKIANHEDILNSLVGVDDYTVTNLSAFEQHDGFLSSTGTWTNVVTTKVYKHIVIPITNIGSNFTFTAVAGGLYYGGLKTYSVPTENNETVDYSDAIGWTNRIYFRSDEAGGIESKNIPDDVKFLVLCVIQDSNDRTPSNFALNIPGSEGIVSELVEENENFNKALYNEFDVDVPWENGTFSRDLGSPSSNSNSNARKRNPNVISFDFPVLLKTDEEYYVSACFYELVNNEYILVEKYDYVPYGRYIKANKAFRLTIRHKDNIDISDVSSDVINEHINLIKTEFSNIVKNGVNWCAMGDSITAGYIAKYNYNDFDANTEYAEGDFVVYKNRLYRFNSTHIGTWNYSDVSYPDFDPENSYSVNDLVFNDDILYKFTNAHTGAWNLEDVEAIMPISSQSSFVLDNENCWATKAAILNHWNLDNRGIGGSGYIKEGATNANYPDLTKTPAWALSAEIDYSGYNLVTIALGINDWKGNVPLGELSNGPITGTPTTAIAGMQKTIENIMKSNPNAKIIVILPINCLGTSYNYGTKETNYGLGFTINGKTLNEYVNGIISVCEYYGLEYIDMTHYSCVNRENIFSNLADGVHPNKDCHNILGYELSRKISF